MRKIISLLFFISIFSCATKKFNLKKHTEIDNATIAKLYPNFSVAIPKNWFGYVESHNKFAISPRVFKGNKRNKFYAVNNIYITISKINTSDCTCNTIEETTEYIVTNYKKYNPNATYKVIEDKHPTYGKMYFITFKTKTKKPYYILKKEKFKVKAFINSKTNDLYKINFTTVLHKENQKYTVEFSSLEKHYKKYIKDLVSIVTSLKINEIKK